MVTRIINHSGKAICIVNMNKQMIVPPYSHIDAEIDYNSSFELSVNETSHFRTYFKKTKEKFLSYEFTVTSNYQICFQNEFDSIPVIELTCFEKSGEFGSHEWYVFVEPKSNVFYFELDSLFIKDKDSIYNEVLENDKNIAEIHKKNINVNENKFTIFMHTFFSSVPISAFVLFVLSGHVKKTLLLSIIVVIWLTVWIICYLSSKCYDFIIGKLKKTNKVNENSNNQATTGYKITDLRFTEKHIKEVFFSDNRKEML